MATNFQTPLDDFLLENPSIRFIRKQWVDLSGVLRTRIVPKAHCLHLGHHNSHTCTAPLGMIFPVSDLQVSATPPSGRIELHPDWSSLALCHYAPGHASVMCFTYIPSHLTDPYYLCPRNLLKETCKRAYSKHELSFLVGFEIEFVILDPSLKAPITSDPITSWSTTSGLRSTVLSCLEEITLILEQSGICVQEFHTESPNQLEIATGPLSPVDAIDALYTTHEIIKTIFAQHNLHATMAPNAITSPKTGAHTHISFSPSNSTYSWPPDTPSKFLAGMLSHLRSLSIFGLANYDSYSRVTDFLNGAGTHVSWGTQNRDVPVRQISISHWELRCVDATANFYLLLHLVISSGLHGISQNLPLKQQDLVDYPSTFSTVRLKDMGIEEMLPKSMKEAVEVLKENEDLKGFLSAELKADFVKLKELEERAFQGMGVEERRRRFVESF